MLGCKQSDVKNGIESEHHHKKSMRELPLNHCAVLTTSSKRNVANSLQTDNKNEEMLGQASIM